MRRCAVVMTLVFTASFALAAPPRKRPYRLPDVDIKQRVIWGASCDGPDGTGLAFGGQDQRSDDGRPHTRVRREGKWAAVHEELRRANPLQPLHGRVRGVRDLQKNATAAARRVYFKGVSPRGQATLVRRELLPLMQRVVEELAGVIAATKAKEDLAGYSATQAGRALHRIETVHKQAARLVAGPEATAATIKQMAAMTVELEKAAEYLDAEPPPRALSPIVYDPHTKLYVLFGGDHLDYLTNDVWVFDPAAGQWRQHHPGQSPPPRANHTLTAGQGGRIMLTGGYTYSSNTDYCGGQYIDIGDGPWTYDVARRRWTGQRNAVGADSRTYRTGPFHPDFYLRGPAPLAATTAGRLAGLPANTWVAMSPPHLPRLNRDWGTAVLDADHDVILRFSGGHSAHGGTDVLHYHLSTNRWELSFGVEFPLGQLYANTRYPDGYNFNRRPWVTGHTYQNYGYDSVAKKMLFAGRPEHYYVYDPTLADWVGRGPKPKGMVYNSCFYTITTCPTPEGLAAWTRSGEVFRFEAAAMKWARLSLTGVKLPGAVVDNSTVVYDSKRNRLLIAVKGYGRKHTYDGELYAIDLKTRRVSALSPAGMAAAGAISYLCQIRYHAANDILLVGATLPPGPDGLRRTPAYDCATNRWISLRITGTDPSGAKGRNVSLGLMYDKRRKLFWAVDTNSRVYVLRLEPKTADARPLTGTDGS